MAFSGCEGELELSGHPVGANRLLHVFGRELISYEESISAAFDALVFHCSSSPVSARLAHASVRRILTDSALFSLVFFPTKNSGRAGVHAKERANFLREALGVETASILQNRTLRNHISHLDDRLDHWATESQNKTFGRGMLGSRSDAKQVGLNNDDILGLFDPATFAFLFLADDIQIDDLVGEVREVSHTARRLLRGLPWTERST